MNELRAIDTVYNGYKFRSRLEARWAVFMDVLDVEYAYEPEGFDLPEAGYYLPDFWLPKLGIWLEIKPDEPIHEEKLKASKLAELSGNHVVIMHGQITVPEVEYVADIEFCIKSSTCWGIAFYGSLDDPFCDGITSGLIGTLPSWLRELGYDAPEFDGTMECARLLKRMNYEAVMAMPEGALYGDRHRYGFIADKIAWFLTQDDRYILKQNGFGMWGWLRGRLFDAYTTAQQARFEHGVTPKVYR